MHRGTCVVTVMNGRYTLFHSKYSFKYKKETKQKTYSKHFTLKIYAKVIVLTPNLLSLIRFTNCQVVFCNCLYAFMFLNLISLNTHSRVFLCAKEEHYSAEMCILSYHCKTAGKSFLCAFSFGFR